MKKPFTGALYDQHSTQCFRLGERETLPQLLRRVAKWIEQQPKEYDVRVYNFSMAEPGTPWDIILAFTYVAPWNTILGSDEDPEEKHLRLKKQQEGIISP